MQTVVITPETNPADEIELIHAFFANGLLKLHLRKPFFTPADYRNFLGQIDKKFHPLISIHGCFELLQEFPELGIHFSSRLREDKALIRAISQAISSSCSASFHSWKEIEDNPYPFDYAFISPVFDSISKKGYKAAIDLSGARRLKQKITKEKQTSIIALGGIDAGNIDILYQNGFDGIAVLGAIWKSADPVAAFLQIKEAIKKAGA